MAMTARECLELHALWENTPKEVVAENINRIFGYYDLDRTSSPYLKTNRRTTILCRITNTERYTVLAWFNRSRHDVKIPLLKLCVIAESFDLDIACLFSKDGAWYFGDDKLRSRLDTIVNRLTEEAY